MDLLRADLAAVYPQWALRVAHAGLVLAPPTDVELFELAAIVAEPGAIVAPGDDGFVPWPTGTPEAVDVFLRHHWGLRVRPTPAGWQAPFAVVDGGRAVGITVLWSRDWAMRRVVTTRTWLARADQGRGVGRRVRLMLLDLAFDGLGATRAETTAADGNHAAHRVARRCGYTETGRGVGGDGVPETHFAVTPSAWRRRRLSGVELDGVDAFLAAL